MKDLVRGTGTTEFKKGGGESSLVPVRFRASEFQFFADAVMFSSRSRRFTS